MAFSVKEFLELYKVEAVNKDIEKIEEFIDAGLKDYNYIDLNSFFTPEGTRAIVFEIDATMVNEATAHAIISKYTEGGWMKVEMLNKTRPGSPYFSGSYLEIKLHITSF